MKVLKICGGRKVLKYVVAGKAIKIDTVCRQKSTGDKCMFDKDAFSSLFYVNQIIILVKLLNHSSFPLTVSKLKKIIFSRM